MSNPEPSDGMPEPVVSFSTFTSWIALGEWFRAQIEEPTQVTPDLKRLAERLTEGAADPREKLRRLYRHVAQKIRYTSLSFGLGAYRPHDAAVTQENRYGDCKDKHALLAALLGAVGIEAAPALVNVTVDIDPDVPSPLEFDHIITRVTLGEEEIWLDSTQADAPLGVLMPSCPGDTALVIEPDASRLVTIPQTGPVPNRNSMHWQGEMDEQGEVVARVTMTHSGVFEVPVRSAFRHLEGNALFAFLGLNPAAGTLVDSKGDGFRHSDPEDLSGPFRFSYVKRTPRFLNPLDDHPSIPLFGTVLGPPFDLDWIVDQADANRLAGPMECEERFEIGLPAGMTVDLPEKTGLEYPYASYRSEYSFESGLLEIVRTYKAAAVQAHADQADAVQQFMEAIGEDLRKQLTFHRASPVDLARIADRLDAHSLALAASERIEAGQAGEARELIDIVLEKGPEIAQTWGIVGYVCMSLRDPECAKEAFTRLLELKPGDKWALHNLEMLVNALGTEEDRLTLARLKAGGKPEDAQARGEVARELMEQGKLDEADEALKEAVELDPANALLHVMLGDLHLRQDRIEEGRAEFDHALELARDPAVYNGIARAMAGADLDLDTAFRYASSAVTRVQAEVQLLDSLRGWRRSVEMQRALAAYLDTLGWIELRRGRAKQALPLLEASNRLHRNEEVAHHAIEAAVAAGEFDRALLYYGVEAMRKQAEPFGENPLIPLPKALANHVLVNIGNTSQLKNHLAVMARELMAASGRCWPEGDRFTIPEKMPDGLRPRFVFIVVMIGASGEVKDSKVIRGAEPWSSAASADVRRFPWDPVQIGDAPIVSVFPVLFTYAPDRSISAQLSFEILESGSF
jgi:Tfp pilus assembly protein PilF